MALLLLVLVRDANVDETNIENDEPKPQKDHTEQTDETNQSPPTSHDDPLMLDAALGLVPPKPPEGKDYLPLEFVHATKTGVLL